MSPNICSLAIDEAKELDLFEPDLKVIINQHYSKSLASPLTSKQDVTRVSGRITVSF